MSEEHRGELRDGLGPGEALRFETALRDGRLGLTDDRMLVLGDEAVSVPFDNVREVTIQSIDWYLIVLSVVLLGIAGVVLPNDPLLGGAFALFAVGNGYWTYRKRNRVRVKTHSKPKPITFYVEDPEALSDALERALAEYSADIA